MWKPRLQISQKNRAAALKFMNDSLLKNSRQQVPAKLTAQSNVKLILHQSREYLLGKVGNFYANWLSQKNFVKNSKPIKQSKDKKKQQNEGKI